MNILKWKNFQSLLEAKIQYLNKLKHVLGKMDHPLAKNLLELEDKDLDININYFNIKDSDYLEFYQDDKVSKWIYLITDNDGILYFPLVEKELNISCNLHIFAGMEGTIESDVDSDLIKKYYPRFNFNRVVILKTSDGYGLIDFKYLKPIKPEGKEQIGKIGRTFQSLLQKSGYNPSPKEIEDLVNNYKKVVSDKSNNMELVTGEDIRKYYSHKTATSLRKGTLAGSCMRYDYCQDFLDIYTKNSNVHCLILKSVDEGDKIFARALVWKLENGKYFMDRIYTTHDYEVGIFIDYAKENGWIYKERQDSGKNGFKLGDDIYNHPLVVQLEEVEFNYYPYLDTLKYLDQSTKKISNINNGTLPLESTDGELGVTCDFCGGSGRLDCPECDGQRGNRNCGMCYGSGMADCPECS
jgi:hypothetical protein